MQTEYSIRQPEHLVFRDGARRHYGANQAWYNTFWQRQAGCGPTVAAMVLQYMAHTRINCSALCPYATGDKQGMLALMEELWRYVTPRMTGANCTHYTEGVARFGAHRGVALACDVLELPPHESRPDIVDMMAFLQASFQSDLPVAFLNYSSGALTNLETWHWVTLVSCEGETAVMHDQSKRVRLDMGLWRRTAVKSGWLVRVREAQERQAPVPR